MCTSTSRAFAASNGDAVLLQLPGRPHVPGALTQTKQVKSEQQWTLAMVTDFQQTGTRTAIVAIGEV